MVNIVGDVDDDPNFPGSQANPFSMDSDDEMDTGSDAAGPSHAAPRYDGSMDLDP